MKVEDRTEISIFNIPPDRQIYVHIFDQEHIFFLSLYNVKVKKKHKKQELFQNFEKFRTIARYCMTPSLDYTNITPTETTDTSV